MGDREKVLIIGLDGATWKLIDPLLERGELPNIAKLVKAGTRGVLRSTTIPTSPAAWTSFSTGRNVENHGILDFSHRKDGTYESVPYSSLDRRGETLWKILGDNERKVIILNVPGTYPVDEVNGCMVSGFPTPEENEDFTHPKALLKELREATDDGFRFQPIVNAQQEADFLEEMFKVTDYVHRATVHLMKNKEWDLLMTVFVGPDAVGHVFWKYMEEEHPKYDADAPESFKTAVDDIYRELDRRIGELVGLADDGATVFLMSDHGFGHLHYVVSLNNWLLEKGYLALKEGLGTKFRHGMFRMGMDYNNLFKMLKALRLTKRAAKASYSKSSKAAGFVNNFFITNDDIDWKRTKAYCMGNMGQLFVNLKGREPDGIVRPDDYEGLVNGIQRDLKELKDPSNDNIIFDCVLKKDEAFPDAKAEDMMPDILFYDSKMRYTMNRFFEWASRNLITVHPIWSGTHTLDGMFLAMKKGEIQEGKELEGANIMDIAPTVLHVMGLALPEGMDGRVLSGLFEEGSVLGKRKVERRHLTEEDRLKSKIGQLKRSGRI